MFQQVLIELRNAETLLRRFFFCGLGQEDLEGVVVKGTPCTEC